MQRPLQFETSRWSPIVQQGEITRIAVFDTRERALAALACSACAVEGSHSSALEKSLR